jgi:nitric oxide reductase NorD protein
MSRTPLNKTQVIELLDDYLEVEFSFVKNEIPASYIATQPRNLQNFIINLTQRVAATNIELAYQFACNAERALEFMDQQMVESWAMTATDNYDRKGLFPAMSVIRDLDTFVQAAHIHTSGVIFEEESPVLLPFLRGLSGRKLKLAVLDSNDTDQAYTDSETIYLPPVIAIHNDKRNNFLVYKANVAFLWAQIQFGSFRINLERLLNKKADIDKFCTLETLRLDACIQRELPGLHRSFPEINDNNDDAAKRQKLLANPSIKTLLSKQANAHTSLNLINKINIEECPSPCCFHGGFNLEAVNVVMNKRIDKEKALFRIALSEIADEHKSNKSISDKKPVFKIRGKNEADSFSQNETIELEYSGEFAFLPDHVNDLITSIVIDFGEIPLEYLVAAGPGEYDLKKYIDEAPNTDDVWKGTYHEDGAELYNEWNFKRQHYHKNWCVLREIEVQPVFDDFVEQTLNKHRGLLKSLRHTFEILRGENKLLKKQPYGDDIDIDALVEAITDSHTGIEMSNRVFTKMHKEERNVAVIFMVDMSGSTKGWINDAERESLILLAEVLEVLGDRYAIYGFSGMTRKRCDLYKIKSFDEPYDDNIKARISNITPQDYTRMGTFIRHATKIFSEIEASTKLLITISDGKPDDYDTYRGEYGVEDTRQALYEAHRDGIHAFCITIDEKARDYLPHMYGAANYAVIDDITKLPLKVSDIYRRITT